MDWIAEVLFGRRLNTEIGEALRRGGTIVDVREASEFVRAHVIGSHNCPLRDLDARARLLGKLPRPLVLCGRSLRRVRRATAMLRAAGVECVDGGKWHAVRAALYTTDAGGGDADRRRPRGRHPDLIVRQRSH